MLDNPIWNSLTTAHAHLAVGTGLARRYPASIGPLAALRAPTPEAWADLAAITPPDDIAVLFLDQPADPPAGWQLLRDGALLQMLCPNLPGEILAHQPILSLTSADFPEMVALATLTEPGPFRAQTASLGGFLGIRAAGRLAAMAGRRLAPTGFAVISAVCTHPGFRGHGYARALVSAVTRAIHADGLTPFLTSFAANHQAIRVYEQVGFVPRRTLHLAAVKSPSPS